MKYKNYLNEKLGTGQIFTTDNLLKMTMNDLLDKEDVLGYQYNKIGLPDDRDLLNSTSVQQKVLENGLNEWYSASSKMPLVSNSPIKTFNSSPNTQIPYIRAQKSTSELLEEEKRRQQMMNMEQSDFSESFAPQQSIEHQNSLPEDIEVPQLGSGQIDMNLAGRLAKEGVGKIKNVIKKQKTSTPSTETPTELTKAIEQEVQGIAPKSVIYDSIEKELDSKWSTMEEIPDVLHQPKRKSSIEGFDEDAIWSNLKQDLQDPNYGIQEAIEELEKTEMYDEALDKRMEGTTRIDEMKKSTELPQDTEPSAYRLEGSVIKDEEKTFKDKLKDFAREHIKPYRDYEGLTPMEKLQKWGGKHIGGFTGSEYYGLSLRLSDDGKPSKKDLKDNDFYKLSDIHNEETRKRIEANIIHNKKLDPNDPATYEKIKDVQVVIPKQSSTLHKQFKNSDKLAEYILGNYNNLKNKPGTMQDGSIAFERPSKWRMLLHPAKGTDESALFTVLHNTDISSKVNEDGSMDITPYDYYDFDEMELGKYGSVYGNRYVNINNRAYNQQQAGKLENYSLSMPVHLTKEDVDEIMRKYNRKKR